MLVGHRFRRREIAAERVAKDPDLCASPPPSGSWMLASMRPRHVLHGAAHGFEPRGRKAGNVTGIAGEDAGLRPAKGSRMLRFLRVDQGRPAAAPAMSSDVWRGVDLRKARDSEWQGRTLEVRALLSRSSPPKAPTPASFALTVVTWSGEA